MEGMHLIKDLLHDFLIKIDLKDAYFGIPLNKSSRKYIRFQWERNLYEFLCLCFGLGSAPMIFTKLLKVLIALLSRINVRIIIFLDDMLLMAQTLKGSLQAKETLIFLLQNLGFVINIKKSQLTPVKEIEFLGLVINSVNMTLALPQEKDLDIQKQMHATYSVTKDHNYGINQTPRKTLVHCSGGASRENSVLVLAATTNSASERNRFLSNQNKIKPTFTGRVEVVEGEFTSSEWQTTENRNATITHPNRCIQKRLRGSLSGNHHRGNLVILGKGKT